MKKIISFLFCATFLFTTLGCVNFSAHAAENTATQISFSSPIASSFDKNHTTKQYMLTLSQSGTVNFECFGNLPYNFYLSRPEDFYSYASLYKNYVNYDTQRGQAYANFSFRLVAGTYCITVTNETYQNYASYNFTCTFTSANESFFESRTIDNDSFKHAYGISTNTLYTGQLALNDFYDYYYFDTTKDITNIYLKSNSNISYELYTSSQSSIDSFKLNSENNFEHKAAYKLTKGRYYLKIYTNDTIGCEYIFSVDEEKEVINKPGKTSLKKVTSKKKNHTIKTTWKKCKYANGYQIYYSKNKKFNKISKKVNIKGGNITTYTAKNLKKGKKYYVKVRAYKYIDNKKIYGKWSNVKSVKCK